MARADQRTVPARRHSGAPCTVSLLLIVVAASATAAEDPFGEGKARYAQEDYRGAVQAFEQAVAARPKDSDYHHWLGRAYGRLAQTSGRLRALRLAPKVRDAFERAVRLDGTNAAALSDLMRYYEQAPAFLGGSEEKARQVRERLEALGAATPDDG